MSKISKDSKGQRFVDIFVDKERYMRVSEVTYDNGEHAFSLRVYKHSAKDNALHVGVYVPDRAIGALVDAMVSLGGKDGSN